MPDELRITGYSRWPDPVLMKSMLDKFLDAVPSVKKKGGDVLWLRPRHIAQHLGILTFENTLIHAIDQKRGVREHILDERWARSIVCVYRFRGLDDS